MTRSGSPSKSGTHYTSYTGCYGGARHSPQMHRYHVPFGLNPSGETLQLVAPNGVIDRFKTGTLGTNISSGRSSDANTARVYYTTPTLEPNADMGFATRRNPLSIPRVAISRHRSPSAYSYERPIRCITPSWQCTDSITPKLTKPVSLPKIRY